MSEESILSQVDALLQKADALPDPAARELLGDAVRGLMDLHGEALARMLEKLTAAGAEGVALIERYASDEVIGGLLLLYGLHPHDLPTRVRAALAEVKQSLAKHEGRAELIEIGDDGTVRVALHVDGHGCGSTGAKLKAIVEQVINDRAPDAMAVHVEQDAPGSTGFVPLGNLVASAARHHLVQGATS